MLSPRPKWPRGQNFGLGLGLKALAAALAWPRSAANETAAKKRQTSPFADNRTSHNAAGKQTDDRR